MQETLSTHTFILTIDRATEDAARRDPVLKERIMRWVRLFNENERTEREDGMYFKKTEVT